MLLEIKNLHANVGGKEILKGIDLCIGPGEVHAVMGPNGAGKSTLGAVLTGRPVIVLLIFHHTDGKADGFAITIHTDTLSKRMSDGIS